MQKYEIRYQDNEKCKAACIAKGMKPDDCSSYWDWIDPSSFKIQVFAKNFDDAVSKASRLIEADVWNCPRVYLCEWEGDPKTGCWNDTAFWEIEEGGNPDPEQPDVEL